MNTLYDIFIIKKNSKATIDVIYSELIQLFIVMIPAYKIWFIRDACSVPW